MQKDDTVELDINVGDPPESVDTIQANILNLQPKSIRIELLSNLQHSKNQMNTTQLVPYSQIVKYIRFFPVCVQILIFFWKFLISLITKFVIKSNFAIFVFI